MSKVVGIQHDVKVLPDPRTKWSLRWQKFLKAVTFNRYFSYWLSYHITCRTGKVALYWNTNLIFRASDFVRIRPILPIPRWVANLVAFQNFVVKRGVL